MPALLDRSLVHDLRASAHPLVGAPSDFDPLLELVGNARYVLIGEASHGTHEFYRIRAEITKRLIREKGFSAIAVEADWPDAYRVNRFVRGQSADGDAGEALSGFRRFPQWMWRNADVLDFVGWLREYNESPSARRMVGFYGLDLYSLHASIQAVLEYLDREDPLAAARARARYGCFDFAQGDPQEYGMATSFGLAPSCETAVVTQLLDLQRVTAERIRGDGRPTMDEAFYVEQNARLVRNAERYYRAMVRSGERSWNLRDQHMAETLQALMAHLDHAEGSTTRVVVWAHNSHLGDARETQMGARGEHNLGQLVRERVGRGAVLIGFTTYGGTVTAASDWDRPAERRIVRPALPGSFEALFHDVGRGNFLLTMRADDDAVAALAEPRLERAIGVIYRPETERISHYFRARLARQFDAVLHYDHTRAVEPLERTGLWDAGELPETWPSAL